LIGRFRPTENLKDLFGAADQPVVWRTGGLWLTSRLLCAKIL
jgi:hypothetical protein